MNIGVTEISPREVQRKAEKCFKDGYYCCEALEVQSVMNLNWMYQKK